MTEILNFEKYNLPQPYEERNVSDDKMVKFGYDNLYPNYLIKLYNESPIHSSILNSKATYIIGDGLKFKSGSLIDVEVNPSETISDFIGKVVKDYLIFNCFAVEVIYNALNQPINYHFVPVQNIRTNKSKTKFWYNQDFRNSKQTIVYDRWKANTDDSTSKIFFFDGYFPSLSSVYPSPEYSGSIKSIATDIAIRDFNLNNVKNHFSVSTLITFFMGGNVDEKIKKSIMDDIHNSYKGEDGRKIIVDFQAKDGQPAQVQNISPNDWDKAYVEISKSVADDIYRGHQVTSPMLFGVKTEGQLGGATELETAYEIFKNTYIRGKRNELAGALNLLFTNSSLIAGDIEFQDKPLFNTGLSETLKEKVYTINELRKEAGLPPLSDGDRLLSDSQASIQQPVGMSGDVKKNSSGQLIELVDDDFDKVSHLGLHKDDFEILKHGKYVFSNEDALTVQLGFDLEKDIAEWLLNNAIQNLDLNDLVGKLSDDGIKVGVEDLNSVLDSLNKSGIVNAKVADNKVSIEPGNKTDLPNSDEVFVMYDYVKRDGVSGPELLSTSRGFCKRLIGNNRYYSREDIQTMSGIFGYNVFQYGGGYWHNTDTDTTTTHCRHKFRSVVLKRKTK